MHNDKTREALLPCPFCGYKVYRVSARYAGDPYDPDENKTHPPLIYKIECPACAKEFKTQKQAVDMWNTRTPQQAVEPVLGELMAAAQSVIERWDSPSWKDLPATANYIHRLRAALKAAQGGNDD